MAAAIELPDLSSLILSACGDAKLTGEAELSEKMKSSRFMASGWAILFSEDFRNWAMPLGEFCIIGRVRL